MSKGLLFVISGPSGVGKGTICKEVMKNAERIHLSVSMTTRAPRIGEEEGKSYYFRSLEEFERCIEENGFLEYAFVHGNYYGTPKAIVTEKLDKGIDVILEIDVQGAMKVKEQYPNGIFIFILPPSIDELRCRITSRGTESPEAIAKRLGKAMAEMGYLHQYDYAILNDDLNEAIENIHTVIKAEHLAVSNYSSEFILKYKV